MIGVDEEDFLIATDIDKLIDIISTKKDIEVGKLSKDLKTNRKEVEKWLHLLEEEGVITLVHRMGALHAVWVAEKPAEEAPKKSQKATAQMQPIELRRAEQKPFEQRPLEIREEGEEGPIDFGLQHVAPLSVKKKPILQDFMPGISKKPLPKGKEAPRAKAAAPEPTLEREVRERISQKQFSYIEPASTEPMKKELERSEFLDLPPAKTGKLKDRLDEYLTLIKSAKEELKTLEGQKERMHREGFLSLEKEFEAGLENLEYALLEKEKRILETRERVAGLPDKIEEIDRMQDALSKTDSEARTVLSRTKESIDKSWKSLDEVSGELRGELEKGEEEIMRDRTRMVQMRDMLQSVEHTQEELGETLATSRAALEDLDEKVRKVEEALESAGDSRTLISERIENIQTGLERRMGQLEQLREELGRIEKVEQWFKQYSEDYEAKMAELEAYVAQSGEDLGRLKKASELEYVKKYLAELDKIEGGYRDKLGGLEMEEASIEEKVSEVRNRIKSLMRESSELMAKYRGMSSEAEDFGELASEAREKVRSHREMVEEKSEERRKLLDDARHLKKNSSVEDAKKKKKK